MLKILMYLWTIINDLVDRAEITGQPGVCKQDLVVEAISAVLIAMGKERYANKWKEELRRVIDAVVAIKHLFGELNKTSTAEVVEHASILGALK